MKAKFDSFIHILCVDGNTGAADYLKDMSPMEVATIIYMSQRSAIPEIRQLVGDFIVNLYGGIPGYVKMLSA